MLKRLHTAALALFAAGALAAAAPPVGAQTPAPPALSLAPDAQAGGDPVVARVNGTELHRSDLVQAQRGLPEQVRKVPLEQIYAPLLDQLVSGMLVAQAARQANLANDPEVKHRTAQLEDQVIEEVYLTRAVDSGITDAKLRQRYADFIKTAPGKDEVKARHILVAKEDDAKAIIVELGKGADFATLAKQKSTDPAGKSGGDLGYFTHDQMVPEFADAAFKLKPGEYSKTPVKTQFGWHVIKVEDRRTAPPPSFEEMHDQLTEDMSREIVTAKVKELRAAAKVETYGLDGSPLPAGGKAPPPLVPAAKP